MHKMPQPPVTPDTQTTAPTTEKNAHTDEERHTGIHLLAASHVLKTLQAMRHNELDLMKKMHLE